MIKLVFDVTLVLYNNSVKIAHKVILSTWQTILIDCTIRKMKMIPSRFTKKRNFPTVMVNPWVSQSKANTDLI